MCGKEHQVKMRRKQKGLTENNAFEKEPTKMLSEKLVKESTLGPDYEGTCNPCQEFWIFFFGKDSIMNRFEFGEVFYSRECKEYIGHSRKNEVSVG